MEGDCNVYAHSSLWMRPTRPDRYNMRMVYTDFHHRYCLRMSHSALVVVELRYIVFYWSVHAVPRDVLLFRCAHSPIIWLEESVTYWHRGCLCFMNSRFNTFNTSVVSLHLHKSLNGIFSSKVFGVWDTGKTNTIFEGAVTRQWPC